MQITALIVAAASNKESADEKLGISSRVELAVFAINKLKLPNQAERCSGHTDPVARQDERRLAPGQR
jgi:hypothetical protein